MKYLMQLTAAYENALKLYDEAINSSDCNDFKLHESFGESVNSIALGDNLEYMRHLVKHENMAQKIQLIYIDPPFFTREKFHSSIRIDSPVLGRSPVIKIGAYNDNTGRSMEEYLTQLAVRLMLMRDLLKDTGLIWLHLDRHIVHYAKVLLDEIFGAENFVNEIIWTYKSGGASKRSFARKHDNMLVYSKTGNYKFFPLREKSYNRDYKPYRFKGVHEYRDEAGWYTLVNMKDVWQINMVGRTSSERRGYATQKPEKLMQRIIESCSEKGDLCADFYGGSGAFAVACQKAGRNWITGDENPAAAVAQIDAMAALEADFNVFSADRWPQGKVFFENSRIAGYAADVDKVSCSQPDVLARYMKEDGMSFIKFHRKICTKTGTSVSGYDMLGNYFCENLSDRQERG